MAAERWVFSATSILLFTVLVTVTSAGIPREYLRSSKQKNRLRAVFDADAADAAAALPNYYRSDALQNVQRDQRFVSYGDATKPAHQYRQRTQKCAAAKQKEKRQWSTGEIMTLIQYEFQELHEELHKIKQMLKPLDGINPGHLAKLLDQAKFDNDIKTEQLLVVDGDASGEAISDFEARYYGSIPISRKTLIDPVGNGGRPEDMPGSSTTFGAAKRKNDAEEATTEIKWETSRKAVIPEGPPTINVAEPDRSSTEPDDSETIEWDPSEVTPADDAPQFEINVESMTESAS